MIKKKLVKKKKIRSKAIAKVKSKAIVHDVKDQVLTADQANWLVRSIAVDVWDKNIIAVIAHLPDSQRFLILNRIVGYIVQKAWGPILQKTL